MLQLKGRVALSIWALRRALVHASALACRMKKRSPARSWRNKLKGIPSGAAADSGKSTTHRAAPKNDRAARNPHPQAIGNVNPVDKPECPHGLWASDFAQRNRWQAHTVPAVRFTLLMSAIHVDVHPIGSQQRPRTGVFRLPSWRSVFSSQNFTLRAVHRAATDPLWMTNTEQMVAYVRSCDHGNRVMTEEPLSDGGLGSWDLLPDLTAPQPAIHFDPASCPGPAWSAASALTTLGTAARAKLADATLMRRTRTCTGTTPATCGAWSIFPIPHTQASLTYSVA